MRVPFIASVSSCVVSFTRCQSCNADTDADANQVPIDFERLRIQRNNLLSYLDASTGVQQFTPRSVHQQPRGICGPLSVVPGPRWTPRPWASRADLCH